MTPEEIAEKIADEIWDFPSYYGKTQELIAEALTAYGLQQRREGYQEALDTLRASGLNSVAESLIPPQGKTVGK